MIKCMFFLFSLFFVFLLSNMKKKHKELSTPIIIILSIILSFLFAYREYVFPETIGNDYYNYKIWFETWNFSRTFLSFQNFGFNFLISFVKIFTKDFHHFLFICSFIINVIILSFIDKKSNKFFLSYIIYIALFYFSTFNITRQWIACAIFLMSYKYIENENFKMYILLIIIASLFHASALILLLVYPVINLRKNSKNKELIILSLGIIAYFNFNKIIASLYLISSHLGLKYLDKYANVDSLFEVGNYTSFLLTLVSYIIYKFLKIDVNDDLSKKKCVFLCLSVVICLLKTTNVIFNRLSVYFFVCLILILPDILKKIKGREIMIAELAMYIILFIVFVI